MTRDQKAALRFAYNLLHNLTPDLPGVHVTNAATSTAGLWLEPDRHPEHTYLNEAVFSTLVVRGLMECRQFPPDALWLYRITPEGCTAIGKVYPGIPPSPQPPLKTMRRDELDQHTPPDRPDHRDPHRFRRSSDWRRQ
ncbi:MAG: hypothetical protein H7X77_11170 [Anaerolineae bacterium]|nr:hypothetical protein [Anaerolineae bacterium]